MHALSFAQSRVSCAPPAPPRPADHSSSWHSATWIADSRGFARLALPNMGPNSLPNRIYSVSKSARTRRGLFTNPVHGNSASSLSLSLSVLALSNHPRVGQGKSYAPSNVFPFQAHTRRVAPFMRNCAWREREPANFRPAPFDFFIGDGGIAVYPIPRNASESREMPKRFGIPNA